MSRSAPVRLQLSRKRGFSLQALSRETNGLEAVVVTRAGKWGNPYKVGTFMIPDRQAATQAFAANLPLGKIDGIEELRGKNLACTCPLPADGEVDWCHAAVLLREANAPDCPTSAARQWI